MEYLGLVKNTTSGKWFASDSNQGRVVPIDSNGSSNGKGEQLEEEEIEAMESQHFSVPTRSEETRKNSIFLGHGKNRVPLEQLKKILDKHHIPYKVAVDEPNKFRPISEKVASVMRECGAGILIFTADEEMRTPEGEVI
ncbi:MAG TPA: TIR domain-containing protein [Pyrinomonadaceae bacterium]|nr:TIR domain-containing protein [Pyrinomonadaceae bacterium]